MTSVAVKRVCCLEFVTTLHLIRAAGGRPFNQSRQGCDAKRLVRVGMNEQIAICQHFGTDAAGKPEGLPVKSPST